MKKYTSNAKWTAIPDSIDYHTTIESAISVCDMLYEDHSRVECGVRGYLLSAWVVDTETNKKVYETRSNYLDYAIKLINEFKGLTDDVSKWEWVYKNRNKHIKVMLDNDDTFIIVAGDDDWCGNFDGFIGNSTGVKDMLLALGIDAENV